MGTIVIAPLFETLIHQKLIYWLVHVELHQSQSLTILASAALFGAAHWYRLEYMAITFAIGLVLAAAYVHARIYGRPAFVLVAAAHALHNAVVVMTR